jgi:hypothetical protein
MSSPDQSPPPDAVIPPPDDTQDQRRRPRGRISVALEKDRLSRFQSHGTSLDHQSTSVDILETTKLAKAETDNKRENEASVWKVRDRVVLGFDFYKEYFLNLTNENHTVTVLNAAVGFQLLARVLHLSFPKSNMDTISQLQDPKTQMVSWESFSQALKSFENRTGFRKKFAAQKSRITTIETHSSESFDISTETIILLTTVEKVYATLGTRGGNVWSYAYGIFLLLTIVGSIVALALESLPSLQDLPLGCSTFVDDSSNPNCFGPPTLSITFWYINAVTASIILADYIVLLVLSPFVRFEVMETRHLIDIAPSADLIIGERYFFHSKSPWKRLLRYLIDPLTLLNLISVLPFFILLMIKGVGFGDSIHLEQTYGVFRALRLITMFRLISLSQFRDVKIILKRAIGSSLASLVILILIYVCIIIFFAVLIMLPEKGTWYSAGSVVNTGFPPISDGGYYIPTGNNPNILVLSPFSSIPAAMWWAVITATTVGYGDVSPASAWGKFVGAVLAVSGVVVIALPLAVIGLNFSNEYTKFHAIKNQILRSQEREAEERAFEKLRLDSAHSSPRKSDEIHHDHGQVSNVDGAEGVKSGSSVPAALIYEARNVSTFSVRWSEVVDNFEKLSAHLDSCTEKDIRDFVKNGLAAMDATEEADSPINRVNSDADNGVGRSSSSLSIGAQRRTEQKNKFQAMVYKLALEALQRVRVSTRGTDN